MGVVEEMMCVVCLSVTEGHSDDGVVWRRLCVIIIIIIIINEAYTPRI